MRRPCCPGARDPLGLTCDFTSFGLAWAIVRLVFAWPPGLCGELAPGAAVCGTCR